MLIHQYDSNRIYTGVSREIADADPCPIGWTRAVLPELPQGKVARFNGTGWSYLDGVPDPDPYILDAARAALWERIKVERDRRKGNGTLLNEKWFHSDADSRIQQLGLVLMGANVPAVQWKTMDGSFVTMSQQIAGGLFAAVATNDQALFTHAEDLRAAVMASDTPASVDITTGWPATFGE